MMEPSLPDFRRTTVTVCALFLCVVRSQACPLEIWTFNSLDHCGQVSENVGDLQPVSRGEIMADGTCRTTEVLSDSPSPSEVALLPGTYSATCRGSDNSESAFGSVEMRQSGCLEPTCSRISETSPAGTCDRNLTSPSFLYSRYDPPGVHVVQAPTLRTEGFFSCYTLYGGGSSGDLNVTFAIFGDCNCAAPTTAPTVPEPVTTTAQTTASTTETATTTAASTTETTTTTGAPPTTSETEGTPPGASTTTTTESPPATTSTTAAAPTTDSGPNPTTSVTTATTGTPPSSTTANAPPATTPGTAPASPTTDAPPSTTTGPPDGTTPATPPTPTNGNPGGGDKESDPTSSLAPIVGGAVGGIVVFALVGALLCFCWGATPKKEASSPPPSSTNAESNERIEEGEVSPQDESPQAPARLFTEIDCPTSDEISTLGVPLGLEGQNNYIRTDESTASFPISYIRNVLAQHRGSANAAKDADTASRTEPSTEIDPDSMMPPDDRGGQEFSEQAQQQPLPESPANSNAIRLQVSVPPGRLGMLLDAADGIPVVHTIKPDSIFANRDIKVGDRLIGVDDIDVRCMAAADVSHLIVEKSKQSQRMFTFERKKKPPQTELNL